MNPATLRATAVIFAGTLLLAAGFLTCFERKTVDLPLPGSPEAQRNPYLALGRLLEAMGHSVRWLDGPGSLDALPPTGATLVLTNTRLSLTDRRAGPLLEWVRGGGHLITSLARAWDSEESDPLIDPLGLVGQRTALGEGEQADGGGDGNGEFDLDAGSAPDAGDDAEGDAVPVPLDALLAGLEDFVEDWDVTVVSIDGRELAADFDGDITWLDPEDVASWVAYGETGAHLAQLELGAGRVTALTDDGLARNTHIGERDHAELLARLVGTAKAAPAPVWVVISERWPGLLSQLVEHAAPAVLSGAVLLAGWLWYAARRFGPIQPDALPERRRWIEHLDAVGRFHWRRDRASALIDASRSGVHKLLARTHPTWARLPATERDEQIGELCGLAPDQVGEALDAAAAPATLREADAVRTVAHLERIRAAL